VSGMAKNITHTWRKDSAILKALTVSKTKCKACGCTRAIQGSYNRLICKNCGVYIFKNDREEFKYRVKERLIKYGREERSKNNIKEE
jgi:hypothetical protein